MKNKLITFFISMGIPAVSLGSYNGTCAGTCGNCRFGCVPGVLALAVLGGKYAACKFKLTRCADEKI